MSWPAKIGPVTIARLAEAARSEAVPITHFGWGRRGSKFPLLLRTELVEWVSRENRTARVTDKTRALLAGVKIYRPAVLQWFDSLSDDQLSQLWQTANEKFNSGEWPRSK
jgi:hypothetical protein